MRLDLYRRPETDGKFTYLAVPEARLIPEEATNTDWLVEERGFEVDDNVDELSKYGIHELKRQLAEKAYAVTSVTELQ